MYKKCPIKYEALTLNKRILLLKISSAKYKRQQEKNYKNKE